MTAEYFSKVPVVFLLMWSVSNVPALSSTAYGEDSIAVRNDGRDKVQLWVYPAATKEYMKPSIWIDKGKFGTIPVEHPGRYFIVVRDRQHRDYECGWFDLHDELRKVQENQSRAYLDVTDLYSSYGKFEEIQWVGFEIRVRMMKRTSKPIDVLGPRLFFKNGDWRQELEP